MMRLSDQDKLNSWERKRKKTRIEQPGSFCGLPGCNCYDDSKVPEERTTKSGRRMLLQDQERNALLLWFDRDWVKE